MAHQSHPERPECSGRPEHPEHPKHPELSERSAPALQSSSARWWALGVIAFTQLIVVLDATIMSIALPWAQAELGMSDALRSWVITAYALVFGSLLLLGGRIADYWGRKRAFLAGMVGFGLASLFGGLARNGVELVIARGLQGLFAALLAPAVLALLTVAFPRGRERNMAFAVFGAVAASGAGVGYLLGGALTEFIDWRWCLLVNVVFVAIGVAGGAFALRESRASVRGRIDVWGAITVTLGLGALVYGFTLAEHGWMRLDTLGFLSSGVLLIIVFLIIESRVAHPLLPLRVLTHRVRAGAFLIQLLMGSLLIAATLYITLHLQLVLGIAPLLTGVGIAVITVATIIVTPILGRLLPVIGPRPMLVGGPLVSAVSLWMLSFVSADGNYFAELFPGIALLGLGIGMTVVPLQNLALVGVAPSNAGAASATVNAALQIGGSLGLALFSLVATATSSAVILTDASQSEALARGFGAVFLAAACAMVLAAVIALLTIRGPKEQLLPSFSS